VSREWCIPLQVSPLASGQEAELVELALRMAGIEFDVEGDRLFCFVDAPHSPKRVRKKILHVLHQSDVTGAILTPVSILAWDEARSLYVDPDDEPPLPEIDPGDIRWAVSVTPRDVFVERRLREELRGRGRTVIQDDPVEVVVGARDEGDAKALIADLESLPEVRNAEAAELGWLARWKVRQRLLGNYAERDITQP
jgi:hypothetical protein